MGELKLVGLHEDGEHVVLESSDGQRFRLLIDEALRAAVRRDRAQLEQLRADLTGTLPPREIQARIRAGARAEDVAADAGMPVELVRRYEGPVLAEREFVATRAQATRIGHETGAPLLGDLVTDRLATRGVPAETIEWDASRVGSGPWTVQVTFRVGDAPRSARWTYDSSARTVRAQDDEARWLSETELADEPIPRRHLAAVRGRSPADVDVDAALRPVLASVDLPAEAPEPQPDPRTQTQELLDDLTDRRGVRQQLDVQGEDDDGDGEEFEGFGPQHAFDFDNPDVTTPVPPAHPPESRPDQALDAQVLRMPASARSVFDTPALPAEDVEDDPADVAAAAGEPPLDVAGDEPVRDDGSAGTGTDEDRTPGEGPKGTGGSGKPATPSRAARGRRGRASVPSWDEIVFGAKPD